MPRRTLRFGNKIALKCETKGAGFVTSTSNSTRPLGALSTEMEKKFLAFENAVFQIVNGDGEVTPEIHRTRIGEDVSFGSTIRLLHVSTNSLVCENRKVRASLEKANHKVTLERLSSASSSTNSSGTGTSAGGEISQHSRWRILPRYRIRSEGQRCCHEDAVVLRSLSGDTYLHIASSATTFTDNYFEMNSSASASGFQILAYDVTCDSANEARNLVCSDCIQLLHREERAMLACVGNRDAVFSPIRYGAGGAGLQLGGGGGGGFSTTAAQQQQQQQQQNISSGSHNNNMNSYNNSSSLEESQNFSSNDGTSSSHDFPSASLFVIEQEDVFAGGPVYFGRSKQKYRLKSLLTNHYLCIVKKGEMGQHRHSISSISSGSGEAAADKKSSSSSIKRKRQQQQSSASGFREQVSLATSGAGGSDDPSLSGVIDIDAIEDDENNNDDINSNNKNKNNKQNVTNNSDDENIASEYEFALSPSSDHPGTLCVIHQAADDANPIARNHSRVFIEFVGFSTTTAEQQQQQQQSGLWLSSGGVISTNNDNNVFVNNIPYQKQHSHQNNKDGDNDVDFRLYHNARELLCAKVVPQRDGLELLRVPASVFQDLNFVVSLMPPLHKLRHSLADFDAETFDLKQINDYPSFHLVEQVKENLSLLICHCTKSKETNSLIPDFAAQCRIAEQNIAQITLDIVQFIQDGPLAIKIDDAFSSPARPLVAPPSTTTTTSNQEQQRKQQQHGRETSSSSTSQLSSAIPGIPPLAPPSTSNTNNNNDTTHQTYLSAVTQREKNLLDQSSSVNNININSNNNSAPLLSVLGASASQNNNNNLLNLQAIDTSNLDKTMASLAGTHCYEFCRLQGQLREIQKLCFRLIRQVALKNETTSQTFGLIPENLVKLLNWCRTSKLGVKHALAEVFRNHPAIVDTPDDIYKVDKVIELVKDEGRGGGSSGGATKLLSTLCTCNGRGLRFAQDRVGERLLRPAVRELVYQGDEIPVSPSPSSKQNNNNNMNNVNNDFENEKKKKSSSSSAAAAVADNNNNNNLNESVPREVDGLPTNFKSKKEQQQEKQKQEEKQQQQQQTHLNSPRKDPKTGTILNDNNTTTTSCPFYRLWFEDGPSRNKKLVEAEKQKQLERQKMSQAILNANRNFNAQYNNNQQQQNTINGSSNMASPATLSSASVLTTTPQQSGDFVTNLTSSALQDFAAAGGGVSVSGISSSTGVVSASSASAATAAPPPSLVFSSDNNNINSSNMNNNAAEAFAFAVGQSSSTVLDDDDDDVDAEDHHEQEQEEENVVDGNEISNEKRQKDLLLVKKRKERERKRQEVISEATKLALLKLDKNNSGSGDISALSSATNVFASAADVLTTTSGSAASTSHTSSPRSSSSSKNNQTTTAATSSGSNNINFDQIMSPRAKTRFLGNTKAVKMAKQMVANFEHKKQMRISSCGVYIDMHDVSQVYQTTSFSSTNVFKDFRDSETSEGVPIETFCAVSSKKRKSGSSGVGGGNDEENDESETGTTWSTDFGGSRMSVDGSNPNDPDDFFGGGGGDGNNNYTSGVGGSGGSSNKKRTQILSHIQALSHQFMLLAAACTDKHKENISLVHELVPLEVLIHIVHNDRLPGSLRAQAFDLITAAYIAAPGRRNRIEEVSSVVHVMDKYKTQQQREQEELLKKVAEQEKELDSSLVGTLSKVFSFSGDDAKKLTKKQKKQLMQMKNKQSKQNNNNNNKVEEIDDSSSDEEEEDRTSEFDASFTIHQEKRQQQQKEREKEKEKKAKNKNKNKNKNKVVVRQSGAAALRSIEDVKQEEDDEENFDFFENDEDNDDDEGNFTLSGGGGNLLGNNSSRRRRSNLHRKAQQRIKRLKLPGQFDNQSKINNNLDFDDDGEENENIENRKESPAKKKGFFSSSNKNDSSSSEDDDNNEFTVRPGVSSHLLKVLKKKQPLDMSVVVDEHHVLLAEEQQQQKFLNVNTNNSNKPLDITWNFSVSGTTNTINTLQTTSNTNSNNKKHFSPTTKVIVTSASPTKRVSTAPGNSNKTLDRATNLDITWNSVSSSGDNNNNDNNNDNQTNSSTINSNSGIGDRCSSEHSDDISAAAAEVARLAAEVEAQKIQERQDKDVSMIQGPWSKPWPRSYHANKSQTDSKSTTSTTTRKSSTSQHDKKNNSSENKKTQILQPQRGESFRHEMNLLQQEQEQDEKQNIKKDQKQKQQQENEEDEEPDDDQGEEPDCFILLLQKYLSKNKAMVLQDKNENECITAALRALCALIKFGWIDRKHYVKWLAIIEPVMDGRDDIPPSSDPKKWSRYAYDEQNHIIMECKLRCMEACHLLATFVRADIVDRIVSCFENGRDLPFISEILDFRENSTVHHRSLEYLIKREKREEERRKTENSALMRKLSDIQDFTGEVLGVGLDVLDAVGVEDLVKNVASTIQSSFQHHDGENGEDGGDPLQYLSNILDVLLDNCQYEYQPVVAAATDLVLDLTNTPAALEPMLRRVQILPSIDAVEFYSLVKPLQSRLSRLENTTLSSQDYISVIETITKLSEFLDKDPIRLAEHHKIIANMRLHVIVASIIDNTPISLLIGGESSSSSSSNLGFDQNNNNNISNFPPSATTGTVAPASSSSRSAGEKQHQHQRTASSSQTQGSTSSSSQNNQQQLRSIQSIRKAKQSQKDVGVSFESTILDLRTSNSATINNTTNTNTNPNNNSLSSAGNISTSGGGGLQSSSITKHPFLSASSSQIQQNLQASSSQSSSGNKPQQHHQRTLSVETNSQTHNNATTTISSMTGGDNTDISTNFNTHNAYIQQQQEQQLKFLQQLKNKPIEMIKVAYEFLLQLLSCPQTCHDIQSDLIPFLTTFATQLPVVPGLISHVLAKMFHGRIDICTSLHETAIQDIASILITKECNFNPYVSHVLRLLIYQEHQRAFDVIVGNADSVLRALLETEGLASRFIQCNRYFTGKSAPKRIRQLVSGVEQEELFAYSEQSELMLRFELLQTISHCLACSGVDPILKSEARDALFGESVTALEDLPFALELPPFISTLFLQLFRTAYLSDRHVKITFLESPHFCRMLRRIDDKLKKMFERIAVAPEGMMMDENDDDTSFKRSNNNNETGRKNDQSDKMFSSENVQNFQQQNQQQQQEISSPSQQILPPQILLDSDPLAVSAKSAASVNNNTTNTANSATFNEPQKLEAAAAKQNTNINNNIHNANDIVENVVAAAAAAVSAANVVPSSSPSPSSSPQRQVKFSPEKEKEQQQQQRASSPLSMSSAVTKINISPSPTHTPNTQFLTAVNAQNANTNFLSASYSHSGSRFLSHSQTGRSGTVNNNTHNNNNNTSSMGTSRYHNTHNNIPFESNPRSAVFSSEIEWHWLIHGVVPFIHTALLELRNAPSTAAGASVLTDIKQTPEVISKLKSIANSLRTLLDIAVRENVNFTVAQYKSDKYFEMIRERQKKMRSKSSSSSFGSFVKQQQQQQQQEHYNTNNNINIAAAASPVTSSSPIIEIGSPSSPASSTNNNFQNTNNNLLLNPSSLLGEQGKQNSLSTLTRKEIASIEKIGGGSDIGTDVGADDGGSGSGRSGDILGLVIGDDDGDKNKNNEYSNSSDNNSSNNSSVDSNNKNKKHKTNPLHVAAFLEAERKRQAEAEAEKNVGGNVSSDDSDVNSPGVAAADAIIPIQDSNNNTFMNDNTNEQDEQDSSFLLNRTNSGRVVTFVAATEEERIIMSPAEQERSLRQQDSSTNKQATVNAAKLFSSPFNPASNNTPDGKAISPEHNNNMKKKSSSSSSHRHHHHHRLPDMQPLPQHLRGAANFYFMEPSKFDKKSIVNVTTLPVASIQSLFDTVTLAFEQRRLDRESIRAHELIYLADLIPRLDPRTSRRYRKQQRQKKIQSLQDLEKQLQFQQQNQQQQENQNPATATSSGAVNQHHPLFYSPYSSMNMLSASTASATTTGFLNNTTNTNISRTMSSGSYFFSHYSPTFAQINNGLHVFNEWQESIETFVTESEGTCETTAFENTARILLRKGLLGHLAVKNMSRIVDHPVLHDRSRSRLLTMIRQILWVENEEYSDACLLVPKIVDDFNLENLLQQNNNSSSNSNDDDNNNANNNNNNNDLYSFLVGSDDDNDESNINAENSKQQNNNNNQQVNSSNYKKKETSSHSQRLQQRQQYLLERGKLALLEQARNTLSIEMKMPDRQNIIASWSPEEFMIGPKIVRMISQTNKMTVLNALRCGNALLHDGNRAVQETIYNFFVDCSKEDFFVYCRRYFVLCRDQIRDRRRTLKRWMDDRSSSYSYRNSSSNGNIANNNPNNNNNNCYYYSGNKKLLLNADSFDASIKSDSSEQHNIPFSSPFQNQQQKQNSNNFGVEISAETRELKRLQSIQQRHLHDIHQEQQQQQEQEKDSSSENNKDSSSSTKNNNTSFELEHELLRKRRQQKQNTEARRLIEALYDFELPETLLRFTQLLCEGHNSNMQNYFRYQEDNQVSINVIEPTVAILEELAESVDNGTYTLALQTLATLTETIQGPCLQNQKFIISQNIGGIIATIFMSQQQNDCNNNSHHQHQQQQNYNNSQQYQHHTHQSHLSRRQSWNLKKACITHLQSLLEGHLDLQMISTLIQSLDMKVLVKAMDDNYKLWFAKTLAAELFDDKVDIETDVKGLAIVSKLAGKGLSLGLGLGKDLIQGLLIEGSGNTNNNNSLNGGGGDEYEDDLNLSTSIFIFMKSMLDVSHLFPPAELQSAPIADKNNVPIRELFEKSESYKELSSIVSTIEIMRDGNVERTYFRVPMTCKINLQEESKNRLIQQVDRSGDGGRLSDFFERCFNLMHELDFYDGMRKTRGLSLVYKYNNVLDNLALVVAFVINFILIVYVSSDYLKIDPVHNVPPGIPATVVFALGVTLCIVQSLVTINWLFGPLRIYLNEQWQHWQEQLNKEAIRKSKENLSIEPPEIHDNPKQKLLRYEILLYNLYFTLQWKETYRVFVFVVCAFLGLFLGPYYYCIQPLQIVWKFPQLNNVIEAVTKNRVSLGLTALLLLVFGYVFTMIIYFAFPEIVNEDNFGSGGTCDDLSRCYATTLRTLLFGGGIGEVASFPVYTEPNPGKFYVRIIFDLAFFCVMVLVLLSLIFGIILDSFSELRALRDAIEDDQTEKCFICGLSRGELDKLEGFETHCRSTHPLWSYFYFCKYVSMQRTSELTGTEQYVAECMEAHNPKWFPVGTCLLKQFQEKYLNARENNTNSNTTLGGENSSSENNNESSSSAAATNKQQDENIDNNNNIFGHQQSSSNFPETSAPSFVAFTQNNANSQQKQQQQEISETVSNLSNQVSSLDKRMEGIESLLQNLSDNLLKKKE